MFNLSGSEIVFLLIAGLVVLGPERLPTTIRTVGRVYGQFRRAATGLETELKETFGDPLDDLKRSVTDLGVEFGQVDTEPSPPMRPERSRPMLDGATETAGAGHDAGTADQNGPPSPGRAEDPPVEDAR